MRAQGIESNGSFSGKNIDITGDAEFNGEVDIETGKLHNIQITSTKSKIIDTKVNGNIRVKKVNQGWSFFGFKSNESSPQILELKGHSLVRGDIIFEEDGEVHLFEEAKREGKIVKAKVIQR